MNGIQGYVGFQEASSASSPYNSLFFLLLSFLASVRTLTLVKVMGVTTSGEAVPAGYVDVQPLVNQVDGANQAVPHGTIYHCPYFRVTGGTNAVILDPQVGDIGIAGFADRDISAVLATQDAANPGSARMFDMADGIYFGGWGGQNPTQYIQFNADGVSILDAHGHSIIMSSTGIALNGDITVTGKITASDEIKSGTHTLTAHVHSGVQSGGSNTGTPTG